MTIGAIQDRTMGKAVRVVLATVVSLVALAGAVRLVAPADTASSVRRQLAYLRAELDDGAGSRMQKQFPEGYFFSYALYGLSWVNLGQSPEALRESRWALAQLDSDVDSGPLPLGISVSATVVTTGAAKVHGDASMADALPTRRRGRRAGRHLLHAALFIRLDPHRRCILGLVEERAPARSGFPRPGAFTVGLTVVEAAAADALPGSGGSAVAGVCGWETAPEHHDPELTLSPFYSTYSS